MRRVGMLVCALLAAAGLGACSASSPEPVRAAPPPSSMTTPPPSVVATARPKPDPCRHNLHGKLVRVSLKRQHLWMCHGTRVVHDTAITSGKRGEYTGTPTGHYRVQGLDRNQTLTLIDGQQYQVKYWIPFDAPLFGFHDASWQTFPFGSARYKKDGSHGCVHMPTKAIATLYHWASVGTPVSIH